MKLVKREQAARQGLVDPEVISAENGESLRAALEKFEGIEIDLTAAKEHVQ